MHPRVEDLTKLLSKENVNFKKEIFLIEEELLHAVLNTGKCIFKCYMIVMMISTLIFLLQ